MYTLINGSPKPCDSNSLYFLNKISSNLLEYKLFELKKDNHEKILENIKQTDVIVLSFPLYVDSPCSLVINFFDYIIDNKIKLENKLVYVIINCGFRDGEQNLIARDIVKIWCEKTKAIYSGSILIGAGEIIGKEKYKILSTKALRNLMDFGKKINLKEKSNDVITTMNFFNNKLYCLVGNYFWNKKGKSNKLSKNNIKTK